MGLFILFLGVPAVAIFLGLLGYDSLSKFLMLLLFVSASILFIYWIVTAIVDAIIFRIKMTKTVFRIAKVATDSLDVYDKRVKKLRKKLMVIVGAVVVIISVIGLGIIRTVDLGHEGSISSNLVNMHGGYYMKNDEKNKSEYQYANSTYKVGVDMPAGEYYVEVLPNREYGYYSVNMDANGNDIFYNGNITTHAYITVTDGQYLILDGVEIQIN